MERSEDKGLPVRPVATAPARHEVDDVIQQTTHVTAPRDRVRWGPIWAGLITALTTFLLLELLLYGFGLLTIDLNVEGADRAGTGGDSWVTAIVALLAFLAGGFVAGSTAAVRSKASGLLNGFLVWGLGTVLILILSVFGLGQLFGALGNVASEFLSARGPISPADVPNVNVGQIQDNIRNASLGAGLGLLLTAGAAALGGMFGAGAAKGSDQANA